MSPDLSYPVNALIIMKMLKYKFYKDYTLFLKDMHYIYS